MIAGTLYQGAQQPHRQQIDLEAPIPLVEPYRVYDEVSCDHFRDGVQIAILSRKMKDAHGRPPD